MSMFLYVSCFHLGELKLAPQMAECGLGRMAWPGALGQGTASLLTTLNLAQGLAQSKHAAVLATTMIMFGLTLGSALSLLAGSAS